MNTSHPAIVPHWYMYPPKTSYTDAKPLAYNKILSSALGRCNAYVHIPFCNMKCSFCSLFTSSGYNEEMANRYSVTLCQEIDQTLGTSYGIEFANVYFGGGTPAVLHADAVDPIMVLLNSTIPFGGQTRTVEFSPDIVSDVSIRVWRRHRFDRVSLGVQSFDDRRLGLMRRHHDGGAAIHAIGALVAGGFEFVNVDLIFGGYAQTTQEWSLDLEQIVHSKADSCTFHPMSSIEKTAFDRKLNANDDPIGDLKELHAWAVDFFASVGWIRTSAISFSRTGTRNPIENAEAHGIPTLGFGAGARSYLETMHISTLPAQSRMPFGKVLSAYFDAVEAHQKPALSAVHLSDEEIARRALVLQLHHGVVMKSTVTRLTELTGDASVAKKFEELTDDGRAIDAGLAIKLCDHTLPLVAELGFEMSSAAVQNAICNTVKRSIS